MNSAFSASRRAPFPPPSADRFEFLAELSDRFAEDASEGLDFAADVVRKCLDTVAAIILIFDDAGDRLTWGAAAGPA